MRPNRVTRAGITGVGPSHFSTNKRKDLFIVPIELLLLLRISLMQLLMRSLTFYARAEGGKHLPQ
jgi:hypothetical protein